MSSDLEQLARYAHVEPPEQLDAWVRTKLRAAVAQHAPRAASPGAALTPLAAMPVSMQDQLPSSASPAAVPARPAPASVPMIERLALAVGAVACGAQASAFVVRMLWGALSALGH